MTDKRRVRRLGDIRVTAFDDCVAAVPFAVVTNIDAAGAAALAAMSPGNGLVHPVSNAYLVETSGKQVARMSAAKSGVSCKVHHRISLRSSGL